MDAPLVVIVGETASGKSTLALELAKKFNGEIISADSWQVYKGFDIGTAKPTSKEQSQVPHHLINIADAKQGFSAAEFKKLAVARITDVSSRSKLPIVVGGTGLYIDSLLYDYSFLPAGSRSERTKLNKLTVEELLNKLQRRQISTEGIDIRNKRRLIRLLEANGRRPKRGSLRPNSLVIGIQISRNELKGRITKRVDEMIRTGLKTEVKTLSQRYGWAVEPMKGIGYREWEGYFTGQQSLNETKQKIISSSLQLAKKQQTWFKRNNSIHWVNSPQEAVELVTTLLSK